MATRWRYARASVVVVMVEAVDVNPPELRQVQGSALRPHRSMFLSLPRFEG